MTKCMWSGFVVAILICCLTCTEASSQFTQGPPGNPSAAGIVSGTPAPSVPPPRSMTGPVSPSQAAPFAMGIPYATPESNSLMGYLGLTRAQVDKLRELRTRFYRESRDLRYEFFQKQLEMRKLFADPKVGEAALLQKEKELSPLRQKIMDKVAQSIIAARAILTPEQLEKMDQLPLWYPGIDVSPDLGFLANDMSAAPAE